MVYVDKGSVAITRDGEEIVLAQGEVIFHRPNEFHTIRASILLTIPVAFICTKTEFSICSF